MNRERNYRSFVFIPHHEFLTCLEAVWVNSEADMELCENGVLELRSGSLEHAGLLTARVLRTLSIIHRTP